MECILLTIAIGMSLFNDQPESLAFEECNGEPRVTILETEQEVNIIKQVDGLYYFKLKD